MILFKYQIIVSLTVSASLILAAKVPHAIAANAPVEQVVIYKNQNIMQLLTGDKVTHTYKVALGRNPLGHKLKAGDCRTPEGTYTIDRHKKDSNYYKALHISYPNGQDIATALKNGSSPGGNIMIHGLPKGYNDLADMHFKRNWTKGCIAVNNSEMDEIWQLVADGTPITIKP